MSIKSAWILKFGQVIFIAWMGSTMVGCISYHSLINFTETEPFPDTPQDIMNYEPLTIQLNDILHINVSSSDLTSAELFNKRSSNLAGGGQSNQNSLLNGYLVGPDGTIDFPIVGKIFLLGSTIEQSKEKILSALRTYFKETPVVSVRLLNFSINVSGEVNSPGSISVASERITLMEAIIQAGDFTSYARRDSILIIRELDGKRTFSYLDFNSGQVLDSPYFYLQQNDVVYIRPEKRKMGTIRDRETRFLPWVSAATGFVAFFLSILSLSK
jgi:polysaccharide export outer membrane protein